MTLAQPRETGTETELVIGPPEDPGRYVLDRRVAVDREAATWHGLLRIEELAIEVRVRITHPEAGPYLERDGTIRRWRWQAELVNSLDHPALERVRDVFVGRSPRAAGADGDGRSLALVTNWIGGSRLDDRIGARSDATALVSVLRQIADVVDRLHEGVGGRPIVHRTLCPATISVDRGRVHLEGLGSARPASASLGAVPGIAATWTPPEVLKGRPFGPEGDRWCVGAVAHVLLTGSPPPLLSPAETVDALLAAPILRGDAALAGHVLRLLTPEPKLRPRALLPWVDQLAAMLSAPPAPSSTTLDPLDIAFAPADDLPRRVVGARALTDESADDPRSSLLLEWDPEALEPLLPCTRERQEPPQRQRSLARRVLPYAAATASVLAIGSVILGDGGGDAPEATGAPVSVVADPAAPDPAAPAAQRRRPPVAWSSTHSTRTGGRPSPAARSAGRRRWGAGRSPTDRHARSVQVAPAWPSPPSNPGRCPPWCRPASATSPPGRA